MHNNLIHSLLLSIIGFLLSTVTQASTPVWTLTPIAGYPTTVTINSTETAIVKYIVTNQSHRAHTLQMKAISGISATGCEAVLAYQQSCILTLLISGSALNGDIVGGPVLCSAGNPNECYQPSATNWLVVNRLSPNSPLLSPSATTQALTINCQPFSLCPTLPNIALTGHARQFTIVNKGYATATNVRVNTNGMPAGTVVSSSNCDHIAGYGGTCVITVTPGAVASSDASGASCTNGTIPIPGTIAVVADGGVSTQVNINDQITCDPTLGGSGKCTPTFAATSLTNYSAGLCKRSMNGFSDWYLPSICEMDAVTSSHPLTCPAGTQSMLENLSFLIGDPGTSLPSKSCDPPSGTTCLAGVYWSSTEESVRPEVVVWYESFESGGNAKYHTDKFRRLGVRCVRAF